MNDQFIIENLQYVFGVDALETSRPINIEVNTPAEINSMFDAISYEKGYFIDRTNNASIQHEILIPHIFYLK
jgi:aminopeptidase N